MSFRSCLKKIGPGESNLIRTAAIKSKGNRQTSAPSATSSSLIVANVVPSENPKCERCWHYLADVNGEGLCGRCQTNLRGAGERRLYV